MGDGWTSSECARSKRKGWGSLKSGRKAGNLMSRVPCQQSWLDCFPKPAAGWVVEDGCAPARLRC